MDPDAPLRGADLRYVRRLIEDAQNAAIQQDDCRNTLWSPAASAGVLGMQRPANLIEHISRMHADSVQDALEIDRSNRRISELERALRRERLCLNIAIVLMFILAFACTALLRMLP